jgi:chromosome segregation ATPase
MNEQMVKLLGEIRDELKATRQEFGAELKATREGFADELKLTRKELSSRLDETNSRLDGTNSRLERVERHQVESEVRLATEIVAVATAIDQLNATLTDTRKLRAQVTDHESRLRALEKKRA